jgi:hypothetical protein
MHKICKMKKDYSQVKFLSNQSLGGPSGYLGGVIASSSHFLILTEMPMSREASLGIDPVATMDSTFLRILLI